MFCLRAGICLTLLLTLAGSVDAGSRKKCQGCGTTGYYVPVATCGAPMTCAGQGYGMPSYGMPMGCGGPVGCAGPVNYGGCGCGGQVGYGAGFGGSSYGYGNGWGAGYGANYGTGYGANYGTGYGNGFGGAYGAGNGWGTGYGYGNLGYGTGYGFGGNPALAGGMGPSRYPTTGIVPPVIPGNELVW